MKIFTGLLLSALFLVPTSAFALDKFMNYKHTTSASHTDENTAVVPDVNFAIKQGYVNSYLLTISTNKAITVPTGANFVVFGSTHDIWVRIGGIAAIPVGDTIDGTASELNPTIRYIGGNGTIGIISGYAAKISVMFYK